MKKSLIQVATAARENAYSPYSNFQVGAAVLTEDGTIYKGCNIENSSYGLTNCAERTAIFTAIAQGAKEIKAIAVIGDTEEPISPCGACRQVLAELSTGNSPVYLSNLKGNVLVTTVAQLLPGAFSKEDLARARK